MHNRDLSGRRLLAVIIDGAVFTPVWLLANGYGFGAEVMATALMLVYFFLCDATTGQTIGKVVMNLRTVTLDGEIPSDRAAATRTVLRLIDHSIIGLLSIWITGSGRRQRLGDLAGGTCVVDARAVQVSAPLRSELFGYPLVWIVPALIVFTLSAMGKFPGTYRAEADAICQKHFNLSSVKPVEQRTMDDVVGYLEAQAADLRTLDPPKNWKEPHATLLSWEDRMAAEARLIAEEAERNPQAAYTFEPRMKELRSQADSALSQAGFSFCAVG